jgi:hypothetical protein
MAVIDLNKNRAYPDYVNNYQLLPGNLVPCSWLI